MFERETRREKILDSRHREMKLKERSKSSADGAKVSWIKNVWKKAKEKLAVIFIDYTSIPCSLCTCRLARYFVYCKYTAKLLVVKFCSCRTLWYWHHYTTNFKMQYDHKSNCDFGNSDIIVIWLKIKVQKLIFEFLHAFYRQTK